jgi:hypothetical protein
MLNELGSCCPQGLTPTKTEGANSHLLYEEENNVLDRHAIGRNVAFGADWRICHLRPKPNVQMRVWHSPLPVPVPVKGKQFPAFLVNLVLVLMGFDFPAFRIV